MAFGVKEASGEGGDGRGWVVGWRGRAGCPPPLMGGGSGLSWQSQPGPNPARSWHLPGQDLGPSQPPTHPSVVARTLHGITPHPMQACPRERVQQGGPLPCHEAQLVSHLAPQALNAEPGGTPGQRWVWLRSKPKQTKTLIYLPSWNTRTPKHTDAASHRVTGSGPSGAGQSQRI